VGPTAFGPICLGRKKLTGAAAVAADGARISRTTIAFWMFGAVAFSVSDEPAGKLMRVSYCAQPPSGSVTNEWLLNVNDWFEPSDGLPDVLLLSATHPTTSEFEPCNDAIVQDGTAELPVLEFEAPAGEAACPVTTATPIPQNELAVVIGTVTVIDADVVTVPSQIAAAEKLTAKETAALPAHVTAPPELVGVFSSCNVASPFM
jgi:hypothetical protein